MLINFTAHDCVLRVNGDGIIPSGCVNTPTFSISFSPEWEGYSVTAQFIGAGNTVHVAAIEEGKEYPVPWECLTAAGCLSVSLRGVARNKTKTTLPATLSVRESLITEGSEPQTPTESPYEQYINHLNNIISDFYGEFEAITNKSHSMIDDNGDQEFPTANAVKQYISHIMMPNIYDEMAQMSVWGIPMPSAVAQYVLEKTYQPTWHKETITLDSDLTGMLIVSNYLDTVDCSGLIVVSKTAKGTADANLTAEVYTTADYNSNPGLRLDGNKYISVTNAKTYGKLEYVLGNGLWNLKWYTAESSIDGSWSNCYGCKPRYAAVSIQECPCIRYIRLRSSGGVIPAGSSFDIWRLY